MRTMGAVMLSLVVLSVAFPSASAAADAVKSRGKIAVSVLGGATVPTGQLARKADLGANVGDSGLDLKTGANYGLAVDYYLTERVSLGAFFGDGTLHMNDFTASTGSGDVTVTDLVKGRTMLLGATAKLHFPGDRPLTPYLFAGVAQFHRVGQISRDILEFFPGTTVFEITDTAVGFNGGAGGEYRVRPNLSVGLMGGYWYSGELTHTFRWSGYQTIVHDWSFWTVDASLTMRFPMR
jgi:opacity protein-like surface antigen